MIRCFSDESVDNACGNTSSAELFQYADGPELESTFPLYQAPEPGQLAVYLGHKELVKARVIRIQIETQSDLIDGLHFRRKGRTDLHGKMNYNIMNDILKKKKIAVLYGGTSGEREVSLRSGKKMFDSIVSQGLDAVLIDTKDDFIPSLKDKKIDLACIALHGRGGEDGSIQGLLEILGIQYTGSKVMASAVGMDKVASKKMWISAGVPTPKYLAVDKNSDIKQQAEKILGCFPLPYVVKPNSEGSSLGITIVKDPSDLEKVLAETVEKYGDVFIEEFIRGCEGTVGILGTEPDLTALPILELCPKAEFYDYKAKYTKGMTEFIVPARLPKLVYLRAQETAIKAFRAIGCQGFARVDIIVDRDGTPFVTEVNTIPGMTDLSDLPAQAKAAGISYDELVIKILESAL